MNGGWKDKIYTIRISFVTFIAAFVDSVSLNPRARRCYQGMVKTCIEWYNIMGGQLVFTLWSCNFIAE